jgi:hypothetical protein
MRVQLHEHAVETGDEAPDFIIAAPCRTQRIVARAPHTFRDPGQIPDRQRDLPGDEKNQVQDRNQEEQGGAQMKAHQGIKRRDAFMYQSIQRTLFPPRRQCRN